jgi:hypothetical protein
MAELRIEEKLCSYNSSSEDRELGAGTKSGCIAPGTQGRHIFLSHVAGAFRERSRKHQPPSRAQLLTLSFMRDTWGSRFILFTAEIAGRRGR